MRNNPLYSSHISGEFNCVEHRIVVGPTAGYMCPLPTVQLQMEGNEVRLSSKTPTILPVCIGKGTAPFHSSPVLPSTFSWVRGHYNTVRMGATLFQQELGENCIAQRVRFDYWTYVRITHNSKWIRRQKTSSFCVIQTWNEKVWLKRGTKFPFLCVGKFEWEICEYSSFHIRVLWSWTMALRVGCGHPLFFHFIHAIFLFGKFEAWNRSCLPIHPEICDATKRANKKEIWNMFGYANEFNL